MFLHHHKLIVYNTKFVLSFENQHLYSSLFQRKLKKIYFFLPYQLPTGSGGVMSLCPQKTVTSEWEVYVGTNKNVIFEGSVIWALNPVVHVSIAQLRILCSKIYA